ncbi:hypothetical protein Z948_475 [Sulfitobacter donghicola DSW-25 = KCTC 12864 = JCM 14565]|uniref:Uncharacterized protein n=1 Tax=Sulfitobacter donghicola DSW-25 = KCTC 12864 = JCM 14565 TaxID=1300350 RepID=A0A073IL55_9RHOB|nr:hypothetical protein DSW25_07700 [Sulfitobacter donghicola DSW-25 = KCTC 12864 = JCM 14565]KIN66772.1 hypothetical protein Z948_475 [Sulfitobacter donghicola DSW-25 = KCTC 12864 = JCM 14565]
MEGLAVGAFRSIPEQHETPETAAQKCAKSSEKLIGFVGRE